MGGVHNARMIKVQVCCSIGYKWCMAYAYILVCYVIPRASPSELHKHPQMYTYAIHHYNPCYNVYMYLCIYMLMIQIVDIATMEGSAKTFLTRLLKSSSLLVIGPSYSNGDYKIQYHRKFCCDRLVCACMAASVFYLTSLSSVK